jgi:hypothetical protein
VAGGLLSSGEAALMGAGQGLGAGMNEVGSEWFKSIHDEGLLRLQQDFQKQQQAAEFQHSDAQQQQRIRSASAIAQAELAQKAQLAAAANTSAEKRTGMIAEASKYRSDTNLAGKKYSADEIAASREAHDRATAAAKPGWAIKNLQPDQPVDPATGQPDPLQPAPKPVSVLFNSRTGKTYATVGDKLVATDNKGKPLYTSNEFNRAVKPGEVQDLLSDPTGVIPSGPNAGIPKAYAFEAAHHYLPAGYDQAENAARQRIQVPAPLQNSDGLPAANNSAGPPTAGNNMGGAAALSNLDASVNPPAQPDDSSPAANFSANVNG